LIFLFSTQSLFATQGKVSKKTTVSQERQVPINDFKKVKIKGIFDIDISEDNKYSVKIQGPSHLLKAIEVQQRGETLSIINSSSQSKLSEKIKIVVASKKLESFKARGVIVGKIKGFSGYKFESKVSGLSELTLQDLTFNNLNLTTEGNSKIQGKHLNVKYVNAKAGGSSQIALSGEAESIYLLATGKGLVDLKSMVTDVVKVSSVGNSKIVLGSPMLISLKVSGILNISYNCSNNKSKAPDIKKEVFGSLNESCL
jgi:hypothetical protein